MDAGYKVLLRRATQAHSQQIYRPVPVRPPFLPIPEDTQTSDHTILHSDGNVERGNTASKVKGEVAPKHLLQALLLPLFVLLLLVPGLLLLVEHVRKETNHNERTSWKDQNPFTMSGDGQWPQAVIDVPSLDALQPASIAADNPVDVAKCEGWRDWVDYGSGWKGCIP